jgi:hypothetical protein
VNGGSDDEQGGGSNEFHFGKTAVIDAEAGGA